MNKILVVLFLLTAGLSRQALAIIDGSKFKRNHFLKKDSNSFNPRGFHKILEIGVGDSFVFWPYSDESFAIQYTHGYQWMPFLFTGLGTGIQYLTPSPYHDFPEYVNPIFANARVQMGKRKLVPVLSASYGYSFGWQSSLVANGTTFAINMGMKISFTSKYAINWNLGYEQMDFKITERDPNISWVGTASLPRQFVKLNVGFRF